MTVTRDDVRNLLAEAVENERRLDALLECLAYDLCAGSQQTAALAAKWVREMERQND